MRRADVLVSDLEVGELVLGGEGIIVRGLVGGLDGAGELSFGGLGLGENVSLGLGGRGLGLRRIARRETVRGLLRTLVLLLVPLVLPGNGSELGGDGRRRRARVRNRGSCSKDVFPLPDSPVYLLWFIVMVSAETQPGEVLQRLRGDFPRWPRGHGGEKHSGIPDIVHFAGSHVLAPPAPNVQARPTGALDAAWELGFASDVQTALGVPEDGGHSWIARKDVTEKWFGTNNLSA